MTPSPSEWISVLRLSHDRLFEAASGFGEDDLTRGSYCDDWSVAQVLSHIGSGAEIALAAMRAGLGEAESLDQSGMEAIWDSWNGKSPEAQAADANRADADLLTAWEQLDADRLAGLTVPFGRGMELPAADALALRLSEQAVHAWDVLVAFEPGARVFPEAVDLLVDRLPAVVPWFAKAGGASEPSAVHVITDEPEREFSLTIGDSVVLAAGSRPLGSDGAGGGDTGARLRLPAEAFLRLVYGRLDDAHMPPGVEGGEAEIAQLRTAFPGF